MIGAMGDRDYLDVAGGRGRAGMGDVSRPAARLRDVYTESVAMQIAYEYSGGRETLRDLHESDENLIPPPLVIRRWRRENPDFDQLMRDCEAVRAECMMEETIGIADDVLTRPDVAKNRIMARQRLAGCYDRPRFGPGVGAAVDPEEAARMQSVRGMTKDQLIRILAEAGKLKAAEKGAVSGPLTIEADPA